MILFISIITLLSSIIHILYSCEAHGYASLFALSVIPIVFANIVFVPFIFILLIKILKNRRILSPYKISVLSICIVIFSDGLLIASSFIGEKKISETKNRGDAIFLELEKYKNLKGKYPVSLEELSARGFSVGKPALKNSSFKYSPKENEAELSFDSVSFMICLKKSTQVQWTCDD